MSLSTIDPTCFSCRLNEGGVQTSGGFLLETMSWRVMHFQLQDGSSNLFPGYLILAPKRHVEHLDELVTLELTEMAFLQRAVTKALRNLHAERVHMHLMAEDVRHVHWHVIPRYADSSKNGMDLFRQIHEGRFCPVDVVEVTGKLKAILSDLWHRNSSRFPARQGLPDSI